MRKLSRTSGYRGRAARVERGVVVALAVVLAVTAGMGVFLLLRGGPASRTADGVVVVQPGTGREPGARQPEPVGGVIRVGPETTVTVEGAEEVVFMPTGDDGASADPAPEGIDVPAEPDSADGIAGVAVGESMTMFNPETGEPLITPTPPPPPGAMLSGRVFGPGGTVVAEVTITVVSLEHESRGESRASTTDIRGEYRVAGIPPGRVRIQVATQPSALLYPPEPREVILTDEHETTNVDFTLDEGDVVDGIVVDSEGRPIEGATVTANIRGHQVTQQTGVDGEFTVQGVPPGGSIMMLTVVHSDYQPRSRTNVTMLDGRQVITLQKTNNLILAVLWKFDSSPVPYYSYRVLRRGLTGVDIATGRQELEVYSDDGRTPLENVEAGEWKVEVTVLDPDGRPTDIRGAAHFHLDSGEDEREIFVEIDTGPTLRGTVVMLEPGGDPLSGATVSFLPPSQGFGNFPQVADPFLFPTQNSDQNGNFAFEGIPPGRYTLTAKRDAIVAPQAVDVEVPYHGSLDPIEIIMIGGGRVYGQIIGRDGQPAVDIPITFSLQRLDADGWHYLSTQTDAEGRYEFLGLTAGSHYVWVQGTDGVRNSQQFNLAPGEEREIDFDFSEGVKLTGVVRVNGRPAPPRILHVSFVGQGSARGGWVTLGPEGEYETRVEPGTYFLTVAGQETGYGDGEPFHVAPSPKEQQRDFDLDFVPVDIVLVFPDEDQFAPGNLVVSPEERSLRYNFFRQRMEEPSKHVPLMRGGRYQATFATRDGQWHGATDWVHIGQGQQNTFVIDVINIKRGIRIGEWASGDVSMAAFTPLRFDVTGHVESSGRIRVYLEYETGRHAVETGGATLLRNGIPISRDDHRGWSGADKWNNVYTVHLDEWEEGVRYEIEARLKGDGGTDSNGTVYMDLN